MKIGKSKVENKKWNMKYEKERLQKEKWNMEKEKLTNKRKFIWKLEKSTVQPFSIPVSHVDQVKIIMANIEEST
jgi:hypothetical protein